MFRYCNCANHPCPTLAFCILSKQLVETQVRKVRAGIQTRYKRDAERLNAALPSPRMSGTWRRGDRTSGFLIRRMHIFIVNEHYFGLWDAIEINKGIENPEVIC